MTSRHFNRYLFIERKQQDGETVDEFCSALKTLAKNCDLGDKEESSLDYVHVNPGAQGSVFKGKVDGERTEFRENIASPKQASST